MTDNITILSHTTPLTKVWKAGDLIESSANAKYFKHTTEKASNIRDLSLLLTKLQDKKRSSLIRGKYIGDDKARANSSEFKEGFVRRTKEVFEDQKLHSIMIEVDDYEPFLPDSIDNPVAAIGDFIKDELPQCFQDSSYHWQLSSSAGKPGKEHLLKVHIWFWLAEPMSSYELNSWAKSIGLNCDHSVFNPVQMHYTANPIFEAGIVDPVKIRSGFVAGKDAVDLIFEAGTAIPDSLTRQEVKDNAVSNDPVAKYLIEHDFVKSLGQGGHLNIKCPFSGGHSIESTETSTIYYPANTGGFKGGAFDCKHQSCSGRTKKDFLDELGIEKMNVLNPSNNSEIASIIIDDIYSSNGKPTLIRNRESWFVYGGKSYAEREVEGIRSDIRKYLDNSHKALKEGEIVDFCPAPVHINSTIDALKTATLLENTIPPIWRYNAEKEPFDYLVMDNGILHLPSRKLFSHDPDYFCTNALPYDYMTDQEEPVKFLKFLNQIFDDDQESICTIQEMIGYCITFDTSFQKMFLLLGPPRSGKSTLCYIIEKLIGATNVANPKLNDFGQQFGMSMLENKSLAIVPDARIENGAKTKSIIETLLCITGEDTVSFDKKHKSYFTGKLNTRIILVSNVSPQLVDTSNALVSRLIFLKTQKSYVGKEDIHLKKNLIDELPQIFSWALDGRDKLLERGKFLQPNISAHLLEEFKKTSNPIKTFVEEKCVLGKGHKVSKDSLLYNYNLWSKSAGVKNYEHKEQFSSDLISGVAGIHSMRSTEDGSRGYYYSGIDLAEQFDDLTDI